MVIVYLKGGLGNQLFQYGFGIFLKKKLNTSVYFDISHYGDKSNLKSKYPRSLKIKKLFIYFNTPFYSNFQLKLQKLNFLNKLAISMPKLFFKSLGESNIISFDNNCVYNGYWQNLKYIEEVRDDLILGYLKLKFINPKSKLFKNYYELILSDPFSVCVHVRLGDLFYNNVEDRLNDLYYKLAISENFINQDYNFYVFSENIDLCKDMFKNSSGNFVYVEIDQSDDQDLFEFELMRSCKNFILSKSTFSWMSYFLSEYYNTSKIVVKPTNFLN